MNPSSPPAFETIQFQLKSQSAWITLSRPQAMNSVNPQMAKDIDLALDFIESNPDIVTVVFTGEGKAFCSGADVSAGRSLSALGERDAIEAPKRFLRAAGELLTRIEHFSKPVLAAVNGLALAGGLELVLVCDLVIASEDARFGDAHAKYGLIPGWGASARLPRKIGANRAKQMMFTASQFSAKTMSEWGLVNEVVTASALRDQAQVWCGQLATKSPLGLHRMKQLVNDGQEQPLEVALRNERIMVEAHQGSYDRREGLAAFAEKRKPNWQGK